MLCQTLRIALGFSIKKAASKFTMSLNAAYLLEGLLLPAHGFYASEPLMPKMQ